MLSGPWSRGLGLEQPILLENGYCLLLMGTQLPAKKGPGRECCSALPNLSHCIFGSHLPES